MDSANKLIDVPIDLIMKFGRIKALTSDKAQIADALKESTIVDISPDLTGIRKKIAPIPAPAPSAPVQQPQQP